MTESMWCSTQPKMQRAWDATSWNALQFCPRYYQLTIIEGWRAPGSLDLEFGGFFAQCVEVYKKARVDGRSKDEATILAVRTAITSTWLPDRGPWGGRYEEAWQCLGEQPYRNKQGNRAKCPYAHVGTWLPGQGPDVCGECGSSTRTETRWVPDGTKDRFALVRLVAAYCDAQPEARADGPFPISLDGRAAVELSFRYPLPWLAPDGSPYIACGHIDSIEANAEEHFISDNKTTYKTLNAKFWQSYNPATQVDYYDLAGTVLWPDLHIKGVIIEGAQLTKTQGVRLGLGIIRRNDAQREEFLRDLSYWLDQAERFAREDYWPMNRRNCWLCAFNVICSKDPSKREGYLAGGFEKRPWNPLQER